MRAYVVPSGASAAEQHDYAQIVAVHAALLPTGKVLYFSGDQHDPGHFAHGLFDSARLYDPATDAVAPCAPAPGITDLFCCGHALLGDGRLLIAGGTLRFDGFLGDPSAWIFDPRTDGFTRVASMRDGRWYPTLLTLGNGDVLAASGLNAQAAAVDQNRDLEVFRAGGSGPGAWVVEGVLPNPTGALYPRMHLLPDGRVLFVTPVGDHCATWQPGQAAPQPLCGPPVARAGFADYTSVLLPLLAEERYAARVLVANLAQPRVLDLGAASPAWADTGARDVPTGGVLQSTTPPRVNGMALLLPTGEVLSHGGEEAYGDEAHPVLALELYRPATDSWVTLPVQTEVTRAYHSVSLLLPDGRVWMAGSNKHCDWSFHNMADHVDGTPAPTSEQEYVLRDGSEVPVDNRELRIEIFEPWYVGRPDRPTFTLGSGQVDLGGQLTISSPQAAAIGRVALLRAGTSTHAFNPDQRYVGVPFTRSGTTLTVSLPDEENVLPPGPYLVFVLAQVVDPETGAMLDVPSVGSWLHVVNAKHVKELKAEVDAIAIKEEIETPGKLIVEAGDPQSEIVDPTILASLARAVDDLERRIADARPFIERSERPRLPLVPGAALAAVPITPISPELLAQQQRMHDDGEHGGMDGGMVHGRRAKH